MAVVDITSHAECFIGFSYVEVHAQRLRSGYTVATAEVHELSATIGESKLIHVVEVADECKLIVVPKTVDIEVAGITVVGTVTCVHNAVVAVFHILLHRQVDHGFLLAVVDTGESCKVALAVDHLKLFNHVDRQVLGCHLGVVGEELLAVDKNLGDALASCGNLTVGVDIDTRKLLEKVLHHGIGLCLVGTGIILNGVLLNCDFGLDSSDDSLLKHDR